MKNLLLFICTLITFISCTKFENDFTSTELKPVEYEMHDTHDRVLFDSVTQKRLIEFTKYFYSSQQAIPECKLEWERISNTGEIFFDDVAVVNSRR